MSLTDVLINLANAATRRSLLERLLPNVGALSESDSSLATAAALELDVYLGIKYLRARGRDEEAVTTLEKAADASEKIAEKRKMYADAAELRIELGMKDRAVRNYEFAGDIKKAAEVYLGVQYSLFEIGQNADEKISALEEAKKYADAAELCKTYGMVIRAVKDLRLAGNNREAGNLEKNTDPVKAATVWERNNNALEAENLLFRNGLFKELAATQERAGHFVSAGITYESRLGDLDSALRCYEKAGFDHGVERILRGQDRTGDLVGYWMRTGNTLKIAMHLEGEDPAKAVGFYVELKDWHKAADCLAKAGKPVEAIGLLVEKELYEDALRTAYSLGASKEEKMDGLMELMKKCYRGLAPRYEVSQPEMALEFYHRLNDESGIKRVAANLMEQAAARGDFMTAAVHAATSGDFIKAQAFREASILLKPAR